MRTTERVRVLSSWTTDRDVAALFGSVVLTTKVSYRDVWRVDHIGSTSTPYEEDRSEIVILTNGTTRSALAESSGRQRDEDAPHDPY